MDLAGRRITKDHLTIKINGDAQTDDSLLYLPLMSLNGVTVLKKLLLI